MITHISSGYSGGAGIAARNLNMALNIRGVESYFLSSFNSTYNPDLNEFFLKRNFLEVLLGKSNSYLQGVFSKDFFYSLNSCSPLNIKYLLRNNLLNPVIHLHNMFNLFNLNFIADLLVQNFNVVITLHDQRYFTGGCHHSFSCRQFAETSCRNCPVIPKILHKKAHRNVLNMEQLIYRWPNINFVAPSNWIMTEAKKSLALRNAKIVHIPNVIPPVKSDNVLRFKRNTTYVGVASVDWKSPLKGGQIILNLLKISKPNFKFIFLSDLSSNYPHFWNSIDMLFVPSIIDNSPNVLLEAKHYGIPILASNVGGIPEILDIDFDVLFDPLTISNHRFTELITEIKTKFNEEKSYATMLFAMERYEEAVQSHINFYQSTLI